MECLLPYSCMVTVPHIMVGLKRMLDYRGVGLARFHCILLSPTDAHFPQVLLPKIDTRKSIYICIGSRFTQHSMIQ